MNEFDGVYRRRPRIPWRIQRQPYFIPTSTPVSPEYANYFYLMEDEMSFIRQNATHKIVVGPCVSIADAITPVTTLDLTTADETAAILHDNGTIVDISGYTFSAITNADGYYHLTLQSGITGTVGHLTIAIGDDSLCLPLRRNFIVVEEAVYDKYYASSADADTAVLSDIKSDLVEVYSDTTYIESKITQVYSDTTVVESDLIVVASDVLDIYSDTTVIESDLVIIASDILQIYSDTTVIASDIVIIVSDTTVIESSGALTAAQDSKLTQVHSDLIIVGSDVVQIYSDTTNIYSDTTQIVSDIAALNAGTIPKNQAFDDFQFEMRLASDDITPATGKTVTGFVSLDGAAYVAVSGTISELSNGTYTFDAAAADTNCDFGTWRFTATDCNDTFVHFATS